MSTLPDFLLARLAEDEAALVASLAAAVDHADIDQPHTLTCGYRAIELSVSPGCICGWPKRLLADLEAKRAIIVEHRQVSFTDADLGFHDVAVCTTCHGAYLPDGIEGEHYSIQQPFPCRTLRFLAQPYREHPDFNPTWTVP